MAIDYAARKLGQVVVSAMRSDQALHLRLADCICALGPLTTNENNLPPDLLQRFNEIMAACTRVTEAVTDPKGELGAAINTAQRMDRLEISLWLDKIHSLYEEVIKREQRELIAREITAVRP